MRGPVLSGLALLIAVAARAEPDATILAPTAPAPSAPPETTLAVPLEPPSAVEPAGPGLTLPGPDWRQAPAHIATSDPHYARFSRADAGAPSPAERDSYLNSREYQHLTDGSTRGHKSAGSQVAGAGGAMAGAALVKGVEALIGGD